MKMSKAQGLSLNTMILAGLGLVVLSVLVMLFNGNLGGFGTKLSQGGEQQCQGTGYKVMAGGCGVVNEGGKAFLYTQYFGNFKEGSLVTDDNKEGICCRSECAAKGGVCESNSCSDIGKTGVPGGEAGCIATQYCCK